MPSHLDKNDYPRMISALPNRFFESRRGIIRRISNASLDLPRSNPRMQARRSAFRPRFRFG